MKEDRKNAVWEDSTTLASLVQSSFAISVNDDAMILTFCSDTINPQYPGKEAHTTELAGFYCMTSVLSLLISVMGKKILCLW